MLGRYIFCSHDRKYAVAGCSSRHGAACQRHVRSRILRTAQSYLEATTVEAAIEHHPPEDGWVVVVRPNKSGAKVVERLQAAAGDLLDLRWRSRRCRVDRARKHR